MTTVLCTSGASGVAFLAAALDTGRIRGGRRVLLVANEAETPEVVPDAREVTGFAELAARVDDVVSWNELIAPLHPSAWRPPNREVPVLARLLAARLAPNEPITELVVESVTAGPGRTLAALVPDVPITLAEHSLAAYAPALVGASSEIRGRVSRLLLLDLVPGLRPPSTAQPASAVDPLPVPTLRAALAAFGPPPAAPDAVLLDERYAERGLLSVAEEQALRAGTVRALAAGGHRRLVFAPHPAAGVGDHRPLVEAARAAGAELIVAPAGLPHEVWAAGDALVVGTCSPVLLLARRAATYGGRALLARPVRHDHPDRLAWALTDALLPRIDAAGRVTMPENLDLRHLVDAVGFCLAPEVVPELRERAVSWIAEHGAEPYLLPARLASLRLPVGAAR